MKLLIPLFSLIISHCLMSLVVGTHTQNVDLCDECTDSDLNGEIKGVTKNCYDNMIKVYNFVGDKVAQWPDSCPPITDPFPSFQRESFIP